MNVYNRTLQNVYNRIFSPGGGSNILLTILFSITGQDWGHDVDENWGHDYYKPDESDVETAKKAVKAVKTVVKYVGVVQTGLKVLEKVDDFLK